MAAKLNCRNCGDEITVFVKPGEIITCRTCGVENMVPQISVTPFENFRIRNFLLWFILSVIIMLPMERLLKSLNMEILFQHLQSFSFHIVVFIWILWESRRSGISVRRIIGSLPDDHSWLPVVGCVIPLILFSAGSGQIIYYISSIISPSFTKNWFAAEELSLLHVLFLVIVVPPVEELFFRGILINRWAARWDIKRAVLVSALIFAMLHKNMAGAFVYGFALAVIYIRTRTLVAPIVCHALINGTALFIGIVWSNLNLPDPNQSLHSVPWFGLLCLIISAPWVIHFMRRNWPGRHWRAPYFT